MTNDLFSCVELNMLCCCWLQDVYDAMLTYSRLMDDYSQACHLQSLGLDVDGHKFTSDDEYKMEITLTLAK